MLLCDLWFVFLCELTQTNSEEGKCLCAARVEDALLVWSSRTEQSFFELGGLEPSSHKTEPVISLSVSPVPSDLGTSGSEG